VWDQREASSPSSARARLVALLRHWPRLWARPRDAAALLRTGADLLPPAIAGIRTQLAASRVALRWTRLRLALARRRPEAYFTLYSHLWRSAIRHGSLEFLADHAAVPEVSADLYDLCRADERLVGFHEVERSEARCYRWSEPVALVRVALAPGDHRVTVRLAHVRDGTLDSLGVFLDGTRIRDVSPQADPPAIVFTLPRAVVGSRPSHELVWVCRRQPVGRSESRALGLAVSGIDIAPAS
jgi:hypothetical protein